MKLTSEQFREITAAIWLVGLITVSVFGWWWPGMLVVLVAGSLSQVFVDGGTSPPLQCGVWIGCLALSHHDIRISFLLMAISGVIGAFLSPSPFDGQKPRPDPNLDDGF